MRSRGDILASFAQKRQHLLSFGCIEPTCLYQDVENLRERKHGVGSHACLGQVAHAALLAVDQYHGVLYG